VRKHGEHVYARLGVANRSAVRCRATPQVRPHQENRDKEK
jgi:hypothetical protein